MAPIRAVSSNTNFKNERNCNSETPSGVRSAARRSHQKDDGNPFAFVDHGGRDADACRIPGNENPRLDEQMSPLAIGTWLFGLNRACRLRSVRTVIRSGGMTRDESVCPLNRPFVPSQSASSCWVSSEYEHLPQWVWIHFPSPRRIDKVVLYAASLATSPVEFSGQYLRDGGTTFDTLFHVQEARFDPENAFLCR